MITSVFPSKYHNGIFSILFTKSCAFQDFAFLEVSEERQMNEERAQKKGFEDTRSLERRIQKDHELLQQKIRQQERPKQIPTPRQKYVKIVFCTRPPFCSSF